ncbi:MAG: Ribonucleases P/MRP protein subunit pop1, partial [Paramarteilia canceri]
FSLSEYANQHAYEIISLVKKSKHLYRSNILRKVPFSMRRRAANTNHKRLPQRIRNLLSSKVVNHFKPKANKKAICRRKFRSVSNLLATRTSPTSSSESFRWLTTHIWHVKRFHMRKLWGHIIADKPKLKCYKATHRRLSNGCMLYDASYHSYLKLESENQTKILTLVSDMFQKSSGIKLNTYNVVKGIALGWNVIKVREEVVGPIRFIWSKNDNNEKIHSLILVGLPGIIDRLFFLIKCRIQSTESKITIVNMDDHISNFKLFGMKSLEALNCLINIQKHENLNINSNNFFDIIVGDDLKNLCSSKVNLKSLPNGIVFKNLISDPRCFDFKTFNNESRTPVTYFSDICDIYINESYSLGNLDIFSEDYNGNLKGKMQTVEQTTAIRNLSEDEKSSNN